MPTKTGDRVRAGMTRPETRRRLVHTARRVLPPDDCEDAAHDAVVQALAHADQFREDAELSTWLHRITFNSALIRQRSTLRARRRLERAALAEQPIESVPGMGTSFTAAVGRELEERELRGQLRAAVARLPEVYREVVERCVYEEESADRVAADLGLTPSALRTRFTRARERLRELIVADVRAA